VSRLPHDPVCSGGVHGPQDGAEVVRILDSVQDHDERGACRTHDQFLDADPLRVAQVGDHPLVHGAPRQPIEFRRRDAGHHNLLGLRKAQDLRHPFVRAGRNPDRGQPARPQRFENGVDTVDPHIGERVNAPGYNARGTT
jgi:hypothetical protein